MRESEMSPTQRESRRHSYRIDGSDHMVFVCPNWLAFANENAASELTEETVIGRPPWQFIADVDCRAVYQTLFSIVRRDVEEVDFPFRCDSPTIRREMHMHISRLPGDHIQLDTELLKEESQPYISLLDPKVKRSDKWMTSCAWCNRVKTDSGNWIALQESLRSMAPFLEREFPNLTHGICPPCQDILLKRIRERSA